MGVAMEMPPFLQSAYGQVSTQSGASTAVVRLMAELLGS